MVPALQSIRMNDPKFFIKNNSRTSLLTYIFISIFRLHMFSWKNALLELKIYAVLR